VDKTLPHMASEGAENQKPVPDSLKFPWKRFFNILFLDFCKRLMIQIFKYSNIDADSGKDHIPLNSCSI